MTSNEFDRVNKDRLTNFCLIQAFFFSSYRVNVTSCNLCARAKVKGHIELKMALLLLLDIVSPHGPPISKIIESTSDGID